MRHFINNIEVTPINIGEIGVTCTSSNRSTELSMNVDSILLTREDYQDIIKPYIQQVGFLEGLPYKMVTSSGIAIEYFINFKDNPIFRDFEVELKVQKRGGYDHFFELANGTSYELIAKTLSIPSFQSPYVIIKDDQAILAISMAITLYMMTKEAIDATKQLISDIVDLIGAITPNVGAGITMDIGDIISKVIKVIFQIAYVALLLVALIQLSKQLFELIFPKIRYFNANKVKDLLTIGCQYLGYNFSSTWLDSLPGLTVMPKPLKKQTKRWFQFTQNSLNLAFNKGYPSAGDVGSTVGALLEEMRKECNGKIRIIGNTVHLERRDYWSTITQNSIAPALALQDDASDEWTVNTDESFKRAYITYQTDPSDLHTFDNFEGVDAEYHVDPISVINADLVNITGQKDVNIGFALGARKDSLNWLEEFVKNVFKVIDNVVNTFGGSSSLASKIENRIGVLMISQQYFNTTKLLYTIGSKQPANYLSFIRASSIWNNYYKIDQIEFNGQKIRNNVPVAINDQDFVSLLNNNFAEIGGVICEVTEFLYTEDSKTMFISYREPYNYAGGKVQTIEING